MDGSPRLLVFSRIVLSAAVHFLGGRGLPSESNWASCPMALPVLARAPVSSRIRSPVSAVRAASLSWSMAAFTWLR